MKLLLILLSVMTFTVQSKTSVSADGTWPYDMSAEYNNNSSQGKGNVGKDDVAFLNVTGLGGIAVEKVQVYVRSNQDSGAGRFEVRANGYTIGVKSGTFKEWTGAYDAQNYHAITLVSGSVPNVYSLQIQLIGTANSLHIEKYVITYGNSPAKSVILMAGSTSVDTLREEVGGAGVLLPRAEDKGRWRFVGWTETEFEEQSDMPYLFDPYKMYYPEANGTLWAVYLYDDTPEREYVTDLADGEYLYVNREFDIALTGLPDAAKMTWNATDVHDENQYYTVTFASTDTAYITHSKSGSPIGYEGTQMATKPSPWLVYHQGDETLFYTVINGKNYVLWLNICDGNNENCYSGLLRANPMTSPMGLLPAHRRGAPRYSCHPERMMGMESVQKSAFSVQKILRNGQVLILRDGEMYTIMGLKIEK